VWIADHRVINGLATVLRGGLIELAVTKAAVAGKNEATEALFGYLTGPEFRQRVELVLGTFVTMQRELQDERRATGRRWARREKQIQRVIESTASMYGDLQGLIGSSQMPTIPLLESGEPADEEPDAVGAVAVDDDELPF
jgi:hypothetical protein